MRLIVNQELNKKIKGLTVASAIIDGFSQGKLDRSELVKAEEKLKKILNTRFKNPDELIVSETILRYQSFFRDVLKLDLIDIKPLNEVFGTLILSGQRMDYNNPLQDLINLISGAAGFPVFTFDGDKIQGEINFKYAVKGDRFESDTIKGERILEEKDIIFSDDRKVFFLYPYAVSNEVKVNEKTGKIIVSVCGVPGVSGLDLLWALKLTVKLLTKIFNGKAKPIFQEITGNGN